MKLPRLPIGIQTFEVIRTGGCAFSGRRQLFAGGTLRSLADLEARLHGLPDAWKTGDTDR